MALRVKGGPISPLACSLSAPTLTVHLFCLAAFLKFGKSFLTHSVQSSGLVLYVFAPKWINMRVFQARQVWCLGGKQGVPPSVAFEFWYKQQHKGREKRTFHLSSFHLG